MKIQTTASIIRFLSVFLILIMSHFHISAQNQENPEKYGWMAGKSQIPVLIEEFDKDTNSWGREIMHTYCYNADTGFFYINSVNTNLAILNEVNIRAYEDFDVETAFLWKSNAEKSYFGLHWGDDPVRIHELNFNRNNFYLFFGVNCQGHYIIEEIDKFETVWHQTDSVKSLNINQPVKLTIRKAGDNAYFFINEELVFQLKLSYFFGYYFGFQSKRFNSVKVDWFRILKTEKL